MRTDPSNKNINTSLEFKTYHEKKGKFTRRLVLLFMAAVLVVSAVSVVVMLREKDGKARLLPTESDVSESVNEAAQTLTGKVNFLLVCTDDASSEIRYITLLCADLNIPQIRLCMLSPFTEITANGFDGSLEEHFLHAGMNQLVRAVEEYTLVSVERYIKATDSNFKKAVKLFGGLEYNVPSRAVCEMSGVSFTIEKGPQTLTPDTLMRYMVYLSAGESNDRGTLAGVIAALLDFTLTQDNLANGDNYFNRLSNFFETNISVVDYTKYFSGVSAYITDERRTSVVVVSDTTDF